MSQKLVYQYAEWDHQKHLKEKLTKTVTHSAYCWRCHKILAYPITRRKIKQHLEEYHAY